MFLLSTTMIKPSKHICLHFYLPTDKRTQTINKKSTPFPLIVSSIIEQTLIINYNLSVESKSSM